MLKTLFVQSSFTDTYKWEEVKVPTGAVKKTLFGGEKQVTRAEVRKVPNGKSICKIDGEKLSEDLSTAISSLENDGYEIISITPIISGDFNYEYKSMSLDSSARMLRETEKLSGSGGYGYGYGFSYTEGLLVLAKKK